MKLHTFFSNARATIFVLFLGLGGLGCASARMSDHESDRLFQIGKFDDAAVRLSQGLKDQGEEGRDVLLYLLDLGLALHSAGRYDESNSAFLRADKLAQIKDYTSLSAETATLVTSDNLKDYSGEDFEKVLINTYLAMNYALMGDFENALVEARRVNHKLQLMVSEGQKNYKQNAFARYLSAILYEAQRDYDDAYIDYKNTWKLVPDLPGLGRDLWRCARQLRMPDQMQRWDQLFHLTKDDHRQAIELSPKNTKSEIIVLYENGSSPVKRGDPQFSSIPRFYPRFNPVRSAHVEIDGEIKGETVVLENIEETAIENLNEKYGKIIAKKIAGIAAKEGLAYGIEKSTDSPILGLLARVVMYATDQADVRSWNLLPRDLQIMRIVVDSGTYTVRILPEGAGPLPERKVKVGAGQKVFVNFRYIP